MKVPKTNDTIIVVNAYTYAFQGSTLSLIAPNSAMKVETVLKQPHNPNWIPVATISKCSSFTYIFINVKKKNVLTTIIPFITCKEEEKEEDLQLSSMLQRLP